MMPELLPDAELLQLPEAELRFWSSIDLGRPGSELLQELIDSSDWSQQQITLYGKRFWQPRLSAWYGDRGYRYSGIQHQPAPWTGVLADLKQRVESVTGVEFNSVLLNYYRDQNDSMGMHSDDEPELGRQPSIASLSLGDSRQFVLKHKFRKQLKAFKLGLDCGSLLLMQGRTQECWRHGINKQRGTCGPRINLTFRYIV